MLCVSLPLPSAGELSVLTLEGPGKPGLALMQFCLDEAGSWEPLFPRLALCWGNSMTEARQLARESVRFEDEDAAAATAGPPRYLLCPSSP